jgi:hypothetical protein
MSVPFAPGQQRQVPGAWPESQQSQSASTQQSDPSRQYQSDWQQHSAPTSTTSHPSSLPQDLQIRHPQSYLSPRAIRSPHATNSYSRQPAQQNIIAGADKLQIPQRRPSGSRLCAKCGNALSGQFVRALDATYHLECFTCHVRFLKYIYHRINR